MKTKILISVLFAIFLSVNLYSQKGDIAIYNSISKNENGVIKECIQLDKTTSNALAKTVYTYNAKGHRTERVLYLCDKQNKWIPCQKYNYEYNSNGKISNILLTKWDKGSKAWARKSESLHHIYKDTGELLAINRKIVRNENMLTQK